MRSQNGFTKKLPQSLSSVQEAILSTTIRHRRSADQIPRLTQLLLDQILAGGSLQTPRNQADTLILWLGNRFGFRTSGSYKLTDLDAAGIVGAIADIDARQIVEHLIDRKLLRIIGEHTKDTRTVRLTLDGWDRFHELTTGNHSSRYAFMAMPFGNEILDSLLSTCLGPAAKGAGFDLQPVWGLSQAGLIDDHILVGIRRSRFMVAELTGLNDNVLWEAGFATGLNRPVFYTCPDEFRRNVKEGKLLDQNGKPLRMPFDIEHRNTVFWSSPSDPSASEQLKEMIRNTLPTEAKFDD